MEENGPEKARAQAAFRRRLGVTLRRIREKLTPYSQVIGNSALNISGEGALVGATYTVPVPGYYVFTLTDLGGNALASGELTVR